MRTGRPWGDPQEYANIHDRHAGVVRECTGHLEATLGKLPYAMRHVGDSRLAQTLSCICRKG